MMTKTKAKAIIKTINALLKNVKKDGRMNYYAVYENTENDTKTVTDTFRIFETVADTTEAAPDTKRTEPNTFITDRLNKTEKNNFDRVYLPPFKTIKSAYDQLKKDKIKNPVINFDDQFTLDLKMFLELLQGIETQVILYNSSSILTPIYFNDDHSRAAMMPKVKYFNHQYILADSDEFIFIDKNGCLEIIDRRPKTDQQTETA